MSHLSRAVERLFFEALRLSPPVTANPNGRQQSLTDSQSFKLVEACGHSMVTSWHVHNN
jgi:hypothetical protein